MKKIVFLVTLLYSTLSMSGTYIATGATIEKIANTDGNTDIFVVWLSGGTGVCADTFIKFNVADAGNGEVHKRAYSTALMAFAAGMTVNIYNYHDTNCSRASYIEVLK